MNDLVLTGPYRGISAYGNFAIQVDMPSSATGGSKEEASPSRSGDADGPITWEWDRYNPEHAAQVDATEPVTHTISLDSWRKINVTYLVMPNAIEATVTVNLPETPQDYLPHEKGQGEANDDGGTITAHSCGFEKHPIVLFTSAVEVPIPSKSLTLPLARPTVQVPQGKRLHIDMSNLHITECSSNREVKKPADSDSLSFDYGHESPTPQFNNYTEEVEVNVTWRPQQNKVMNMEYCKRLASNNLCSKIWNGTCLLNQIIYIYIFLSHPFRNKTCMSSNAFFEHYMQENIHIKPHQVCIIYW